MVMSSTIAWVKESRLRVGVLVGLSVVAYAVASWFFFGGGAPGALVWNSGVTGANGVYDWAKYGQLLQNPASRAVDGGKVVPTAMELLVAQAQAQDPTRRSARPSIQRQEARGSQPVTWLMGQAPSTVYYKAMATPDDADPISPPETGWIKGPAGTPDLPQVWLRGSRPSSMSSDNQRKAPTAWDKFMASPAMAAVRKHPINSLIIALCCFIWYKLRCWNWGWPEVGSSYRNVVMEGQVWRTVSASFSHVDLLHLAMNMISLYQVGFIEELYGSALYLVLSLMLVVLTMLINLTIYHILITRFGKEHYIETIGVGYSCVLFAWIVVATAKTDKYCPVPGLQQVCFPTWQLPMPGTQATLPFNAAPFGLLVAMHYIIPKASFVGHLSGIVLGYPLVWGGLDWFGPQLLARLCAGVVMLQGALGVIRSADPGGRVLSPTGGILGGAGGSELKRAARMLLSLGSGARSPTLMMLMLLWAGAAVISVLTSSWMGAFLDVSGVGVAYLAWRASGSGSSESSMLRMQVLLCCICIVVVDALASLARVGPLVSAVGGSQAWMDGLVPASYCMGVAGVGVLAVTTCLFVAASLRVIKSSMVDVQAPAFGSAAAAAAASSSSSAFWFLPAGLRPDVGSGSGGRTAVVQNGVLSRTAERNARLAAMGGRGGSGPAPSQGQRLGGV